VGDKIETLVVIIFLYLARADLNQVVLAKWTWYILIRPHLSQVDPD